MKGLFLIWVVLSLMAFGVLASVPQHSYLGTGANSYTRSGWPGGWLIRNEYKTYVINGAGPTQVAEYRVHSYVSDWTSLTCAVFVSVALPSLVLLPVMYGLKKRTAAPTNRSTQ